MAGGAYARVVAVAVAAGAAVPGFPALPGAATAMGYRVQVPNFQRI